jgi:hypothetical protein
MSDHSPFRSPLADLRVRLKDAGLHAEPRTIATVILGIAHTRDWLKDSRAMAEWIAQLALDVANED